MEQEGFPMPWDIPMHFPTLKRLPRPAHARFFGALPSPKTSEIFRLKLAFLSSLPIKHTTSTSPNISLSGWVDFNPKWYSASTSKERNTEEKLGLEGPVSFSFTISCCTFTC